MPAIMLVMCAALSCASHARAQETQPPTPPVQTEPPASSPQKLPAADAERLTPANERADSAANAAIAETVVPRDVRLVKLDAAPVIDGVIGTDEWKGATRAELTRQVQPGDNALPSERTEVLLAADREHLYLAFRCFDSQPSAIRAPVSRRDAVFGDDYVGIYLDTYDDRRRAYVIYFNPLGIQADGIITGGSLSEVSEADDLTWDGIYDSKGALTEEGYAVEAAIPFRSLRFQSGKDQRWGLHLQRWVARKAERVHWQPISRSRADLLTQMGTLSGLDDIYAGRTLDLIPTVTGAINSERERGAYDPVTGATGLARLNSVNRIDPGLTATYTLTPNLTLSGTLNPDFSQVEADTPQINVNQRFPLFFPERRPFFLEGAEVFRSVGSLTFVNTRQIVEPDYGVKLTGKIGKHTIGFLNAHDPFYGRSVRASGAEVGESAQFNVLRYGRDLFKNSRVGLLLTDRRFAGTYNTVIAADGIFRFGDVHQIGFQLAQSYTRDRAGVRRPGTASYLYYELQGKHWRLFTNNYQVTPDYRTETGFLRRPGIHTNTVNFGYEFRPKENSWWVSLRPFIVARYARTLRDGLDDAYIDPGFDLKLARGMSFYVYRTNYRNTFRGVPLPHRANVVFYTINRFKRIDFDGFMRWGGGVDFNPARPQVGDAVSQSHTVTLRPTARLNTQMLYLSDRIAERGTGARLVRQDIIRNRTTFQFTRFNALRSIIDYDTAQRQTGVSFLYAYTPGPNTALFIGYNDLLFNGIDPLDNTRAQGIFRQRRTLFTKLSYNFRF